MNHVWLKDGDAFVRTPMKPVNRVWVNPWERARHPMRSRLLRYAMIGLLLLAYPVVPIVVPSAKHLPIWVHVICWIIMGLIWALLVILGGRYEIRTNPPFRWWWNLPLVQGGTVAALGSGLALFLGTVALQRHSTEAWFGAGCVALITVLSLMFPRE